MSGTLRQNPLLKTLLLPASWLYGGITRGRNLLYDLHLKKTVVPPVRTISVGNLTVGGTGKTPLVEYLIRAFGEKYRVAVLSRGYGRKTSGPVIAHAESTAGEIGDEPLQYYLKYRDRIRVVVAEKRVTGMQVLREHFPEVNLVILDDAYQHRAIGRDVNILLSDYNRPFYEDFPFPAGNLRESRAGARRADLVLVTKCPSWPSAAGQREITAKIRSYCGPETPVFFSRVRYGEPVCFDGTTRPDGFNHFISMSGIARNELFEAYATANFKVMRKYSFPDHHRYTIEDLRIPELAGARTALLTTEKDMVKLLPLAGQLGLASRCFYIPIATDPGDSGPAFYEAIERLLK